jgi:hypothetical protein
MYVPTAEMNVGDNARLAADEGVYERRTRNKVVMSDEGTCDQAAGSDEKSGVALTAMC